MPSHGTSTWKQFFASKWYVVVGGLVAMFLLFGYVRAFYQSYEIQKEIQHLQTEADKLEAKRLKTLELLQYVQSPAYVESKARTELNMAKEGEHVVVIQGESATSAVARQSDEGVVESISNPIKWWRYFFK